MPRWSSLLLAPTVAGMVLLAWTPQDEHGKELFERRCSGCHAPNINKEGPRLRGVYGRKAASVADFEYSDALRKVDVHWDEASLERWLSDPDAMAPGTDMSFHVKDADERKAIVAYLKALVD